MNIMSLHYFHSYSVLNLHDKSSAVTPIIKEKVNYNKFLPLPTDISGLKKKMAIIVSCILVENIPALCQFTSGVKMHIDPPVLKGDG